MDEDFQEDADFNFQPEMNGIEDQLEEQDNQIDENDSNSDNRFPDDNEGGWIQWFCRLEDHEFFVEIDEDFIKEKGNLIGIKCQNYLQTILSPEMPNEESVNDETLENLQAIKEVYGLIHRRFITTPKGLALVREKYLNSDYGTCPRVLCHKQMLLPIGLSNDTKYSRVKVFCPVCEEVYTPYRHKRKPIEIDGAFFGTSFPHVFLMAYPDLNPKNVKYKHYIPKVYGFRVFGKNGSKYHTTSKREFVNTKKKLNISLTESEKDFDEVEDEVDRKRT